MEGSSRQEKPQSPARNLREFIALAKSQPGKINYASPGPGTTPHLAGALFAQSTAYATLGVFDFDNSAKVMVMLILGGAGRLYGAFVGAPIYMILEDNLAKLSPAFWQFGIGLLLVLTVLFARRGLLGIAEDASRYFKRKP